MQKSLRAASVSLLLVCGGVTAAGRVPAVPLGQDFVLEVGQTVLIESAGFGITFVAVTEDSRCPVDVTCVWAGNAMVELKVSMSDAVDTTVTLNTDLEPRATTIGRHEVRLVALAPVPRSDVRIAPGDYTATLRVDKVGIEPAAGRDAAADPRPFAAVAVVGIISGNARL